MTTRARIWWTFFWLGCTGFGGGVAVLAQIYTLVVVKRRWLTESEYWEAAALGQSLPGSAAANAIGYIGLRLEGKIGALIAVTAFILPSFVLMILMTIGYRNYHQIPNINTIFLGMNAAVVGLVLMVTIKMGRRILVNRLTWSVAVISALALATNFASILEVVLFAGVIEIIADSFARSQAQAAEPSSVSNASNSITTTPRIIYPIKPPDTTSSEIAGESRTSVSESETLFSETESLIPRADGVKSSTINRPANTPSPTNGKPSKIDPGNTGSTLMSLGVTPIIGSFVTTLPMLLQLALLFLRIGAITFGGGFVMIPLIEQEVVNNAHWLSHQQFVDGMALGQITPGPVIITATFIGYYVHGLTGALVATVAVFLPPFIMTVIAGRSLDRMRGNPQINAFLRGISPAVVGMMAAAFINIAQTGIHGYTGLCLMIGCCLILLRWRISPALILIASAIAGLLLQKLIH